MAVQQGDDAQHILVILIITHGLCVGIEERHILLLQELTTELINVHRLEIAIHISIIEGLLRDEVHDVLVFIQSDHRTIHPGLILSHKCQIRIGILENHREKAVAEDEVALNEQRIIFLQLILHHRQRVNIIGFVVNRVLGIYNIQSPVITMTDIVYQFLSLIAYNYDNTA